MAAVGTAPPPPTPKPDRREFVVRTCRAAGPGSLAEALASANAAGGHADITFDIPPSDPGFEADKGIWRIKMTDTPPAISVPDVRVDGWSQTRRHGDKNPQGPEVVLDGSNHSVEFGICLYNAPECEVRGLVVGGCIVGIQVAGLGARSNRIAGNYVGIGPDGLALFGNYNGIELVSGAHDNTVGGSDIHDCNLVSGNEHVGVRISDSNGNRIIGNLVGTDRTGMRAVRNYDGITIEGTSNGNVVGGSQPEERNIVSGNVAYGVDLFGWGVTNNRVMGNFIGTDVTGTRAVPNTYGVLFDDRSHHNLVGGAGPNDWNLISGNTAFGAYFYNNGTHSNTFEGNRIGTDASGRFALPNETGVHIDGGTFDNRVDRNVISGNRVAGITIFSIKTDRNAITRNLIGTDITGKRPLGNGADGVRIVFGAQSNVVGGSKAEGNTIAYNGRAGVAIESAGSRYNRVWSNRVFGNAGLGIDLFPVGPNAGLSLSPLESPNAGMPAPSVQSVVVKGGRLTVTGTVPTARGREATVHVYTGAHGPSGDVQGKELLGTVVAGTDGRWSFSIAWSGAAPPIAATATDRDGNTSEFGGRRPSPSPRSGPRPPQRPAAQEGTRPLLWKWNPSIERTKGAG
jgi:titin